MQSSHSPPSSYLSLPALYTATIKHIVSIYAYTNISTTKITTQKTYLLLILVKLLPLGSQQLAHLTKARIGVLGLDPLPPVLGEEHICRERTFGSIFVLLCFGCAGRLFGLFGSFALWGAI